MQYQSQKTLQRNMRRWLLQSSNQTALKEKNTRATQARLVASMGGKGWSVFRDETLHREILVSGQTGNLQVVQEAAEHFQTSIFNVPYMFGNQQPYCTIVHLNSSC